MKEQIKQWFSVPVFERDEEKSWRASLINLAINTCMFIVVLIIIGNLAGRRTQTIVFVLDGVMLAVLIVIRSLLVNGRVSLAGGLLIGFGITLVTTASASLGTIRTPSTTFLLLFVIFGGLLYGQRGVILTTIACSIAVLGLILAENAGMLPKPDYIVTITQWVSYTVVFVMTGALVHFSYKSTRQALEQIFFEMTERQRAQEALQKSETRLKEAERIAHLGYWELDIKANKLFWSDEIHQIFEISPSESETSYEGFLEVVHPDDRQLVDSSYRDSLKNRIPCSIEHRIKLKDGRTKFVHNQYKTFYNEQGNPVRSLGTIQDITERLQKEDQLRKLSRAVEAAPVTVVITDKNGSIEYTNPYFSIITGYERNEVLKQNPRVLRSDKTPAETYSELWKTILGGQTWQGEFVNKKKNGELYIESAAISPVFDKDNNISHFVAIKQDITERKRINEELRASEARYHALFEQTHDAVFILDLEGRHVETNQRAAEMLGYTLEEMMTLSVNQTSAQTKQSGMIMARLLAGETIPPYERLFRKKNGDLFPAEVNVELVRDKNGKPLHFQSAVRDITERKRAEDALRASEANFREVFDNTAHGIFIIEVTEDGTFRSGMLNKADEILTTIRREDVEGKLLKDLPLPSDLKQALHANYSRCLKAGVPIAYEEEFNLPGAGQRFYYTTLAPVQDETGRFYRIIGSTIEISELKQMEKREREQRRLAEALRDTAEAMNSSLMLDDILEKVVQNVEEVVPYDAMTIIWIEDNGSLRVLRSRGYEPEQEKAIARQRFNIKNLASFAQVLETRRPLVIPDVREFPGWVSSSVTEWVRSHIKAPIIIDRKVVGVINLHNKVPGFYKDHHANILQAFANQAAIAIHNAMLYEEVQNLAIIDELTGIYNRRGFMEICRREIGRLQRYNHPFSILFVDIDHFKQFNDRYSYEIGDRVLRLVAKTMQNGVREIDFVGRYGGEELIILLTKSGQSNAMETAERLRTKVEHLCVPSDQGDLKITISIGVATLTPVQGQASTASVDEQTKILDNLIAMAGEALHTAKQQGRNRTVAYD